MKPIISITKEEERTHFVFDSTKAIILSDNKYNDVAIFLGEGIEQTTIKGFYVIGVGKWRWKLLCWLIKRLSGIRDTVHV